MRVVPLAPNPPAVIRDALIRRGVDPGRAAAAAHGLEPVVLLVDQIQPAERETLALAARDQGLDCLTGDGWAMLAGSIGRAGGLTRPGVTRLTEALAGTIGERLRNAMKRPTEWRTARGNISLDRPLVVGILNVTPDSFSDGGCYLDPADACRHADAMIEQGAGMLDIGAESTRPGRPSPVPEDEEWRRLEPVLEYLSRTHPSVPTSVDTVKSKTARRALDAGAWAANDVSGLRLDPALADVCAKSGAGLVLMHSRGAFEEMASYTHAVYEDEVGIEVESELVAAADEALRRGVPSDSLVLDPGLGFAKTPEQSWAALRGLSGLASLGYPIMVGPSRKRFVGAVTGQAVADRDAATASVCAAAWLAGARLFRVHAPSPTRNALAVAAAMRSE